MGQLASKVRDKFREPDGTDPYSDMSDMDLEVSWLKKYPNSPQSMSIADEGSRIAANNALAERAKAPAGEGKPRSVGRALADISGVGPIVSGGVGLFQDLAGMAIGGAESAADVLRASKKAELRRQMGGRTDWSNKAIASGMVPPKSPEQARKELAEADLEQTIANAGREAIQKKYIEPAVGSAIGGTPAANLAGRQIATPLAIAAGTIMDPLATIPALAAAYGGGELGSMIAPSVERGLEEPEGSLAHPLSELGSLGGLGLGGAAGHRLSGAQRSLRAAADPALANEMAGIGRAAPRPITDAAKSATQNKPLAAQGAADAAAEAEGAVVGGGLGTAFSEALRDLQANKWKYGLGLGGSALAGAALGPIGLAPAVIWAARHTFGRVGGRAGALMDAAKAAEQSKPVAAAGEVEAPVGSRRTTTGARPAEPVMTVPVDSAQAADLAGAYTGTPLSRTTVGMPMIPASTTLTVPARSTAGLTTGTVEVPGLQGPAGTALAEQAGQLPIDIPQGRMIDTAAMAGPAPTAGPPTAPAVPAVPEAVLGMIERAFDRHGPSGAVELGRQLGLDEAAAVDLVNSLARDTESGARVPTSESVNQFAETTEPAIIPEPPITPTPAVEPQNAMEAILAEFQRREADAAASGVRPGAADAQQARLDAMNALDQLEQMSRAKAEPTQAEPTVPEPKRPAVVEENIPEEMARQQALAETRKAKQEVREKEPGYEAAKAGKQADPLFKETYDKMVADGFDAKTARAAAYKAVEAKQKQAKAEVDAAALEGKLKESVEAGARKAAEATKPPTEAAKPTEKPAEKPKETAPAAIEPKGVQGLLDAGRVDEARAQARKEASNPDEAVTVGSNAGLKIGDQLPNGAIILDISNGRIDLTTKPPKGSAKPSGESKVRAYSAELTEAAKEAEAAVSGERLPKAVSDARDALHAVPKGHTRLWRVEGKSAVEAGGAGGKEGSNWFEESLGAYATDKTRPENIKYVDVPNERLAQLKSDPNATEVQLPEGYVAQAKGLAGQATPKAPIAEQYAKVAEATRPAPPAANEFRSAQATKEMGRLMKVAREAEGDAEIATSVIPKGKRGENMSGLPATVKVDGVDKTYGGFRPAQDAAKTYVESQGRKYEPSRRYVEVDKERAKRIADEYEKMKHDPKNPEVKAAYDAMIKETLDQYEAMLKSGLKVEFIEPGKDPYPNPRMAIEDVVQNNHLWVFPTEGGFGTGAAFDAAANPLLATTKHKISGKIATANDIFRAVHDYFGHIKEGVGFRASGEENAWRSHSTMYSPLARRAMTTETRGQNSWLNFGPFGEKNRTAKTADTVFADQKTGLLPEWVSDLPKSEYSVKYKGMAHPSSFESIDAWRAHNKALGFTEEQIGSALREDTRARSKAFRAPVKVEVPTVTEVRKELPQYFGDRLYSEGDGFVIDTPGATIRISKVGEIEADLGALEAGRPGLAPAYKRGEVAVLGETTFIDGGALIKLVELGEATHEIKHVAWRMLSDKERAAVTKELQPSADRLSKEGKGTSVEELFADGFNPNAPRPEAKTALGRAYQKLYDFFEGIYRAFAPNLRSVTKAVESGKVFERQPQTGTATAYAARGKAPVDTVAIRRGSGTKRNSKSIKEVQTQLKNVDISKLPVERQVDIMASQGIKEIDYQRQQVRSGEKWYKLDIEAMEHALARVEPALKDAAQMAIFKLISVAASFGNKPNINIEMALQIYRGLRERGELPKLQDTGKHWAGSPTFDVTSAKLDRMAADMGGMDGVIKWMQEKHPVSELKKYNKHGIAGKATDMILGSEVLGPKGSAFFQNLTGNYSKTTADMWFSRTFNRWRGTAFKDAPRNTSEFKLMQQVNEEIARRMNIDPADTQAMLWFHEKSLYGKLGAKEDFGSYAVAGRRAAESQKARTSLGISSLTAKSPVKPKSQTIAFEVKFGTDSPYGKKYDWKSLNPEQARKVTDEHARRMIEAIEAETGARVTSAEPSTGVYAAESNPNWIVKMEGTPEQIESSTNLFALGSQQDSAVAARSVARGGGRPGLQATKSVKPKGDERQLWLLGSTKAKDWAAPGFLEAVWKEYSRLVPEIAKDGGASLDISQGSTRIQLYGANSEAALIALRKAIASVDPGSGVSVAKKNFETYLTSNKWSESAAGEAYREALRERGYTDESIKQFVDGADKSIERAWNSAFATPERKYSVGGPGRVRTSTRDTLESLESVRKPRKGVKGVLEHLVDLRPRIGPAKPKAPLESMVKE